MIELDPCASRTVQPRKPAKPCTRPAFAIDPSGTVVGEHLGYCTFAEYARNLVHLEPHIVICHSPEVWLAYLDKLWGDHPEWSWRVTVTNQHGKALQIKRVAYYGFRDPRKKHNRYHIVVNASTFTRHPLSAPDLLALGIMVRSFCNVNGLEVRASAAGIAAQLLRHPQFYPFARRRVPHFINEDARPHLPGGYHESYADVSQRLESALYIDQEAAHHYAAETTPLPNSNTTRAIGYTRASERPYARRGTRLYARELRNHGLIKARVCVPTLTPQALRFAPTLMHTAGDSTAFIWTNELPLLGSFGLEVQYIIGVWGTSEVDRGLQKYAQWARQTQERYPQLKSLLLMPYGLLARRRSVVTYHHPGGKTELVLANQHRDDTKRTRVVTQPDTANALQLGLIQAFVRALSLDLARQLSAREHEVLSIYADAVLVKLTESKSIPMFAPWRVKGDAPLEIHEAPCVPVSERVRQDYLTIKGS